MGPTPVDVLKVNINGAFLMEQKSGGWSFVVRDKDGAAVMAGAWRLESVHDTFRAEAQACLVVYLNSHSSLGTTIIQLESHSSNLVCTLKSSAFDQLPAGVLLRETRQQIQLDFVNFEVMFTQSL
ncbi:uncharacterized protein C2845_PM17G08960 [Panicum miliaceum]|uniref:RNase H type-1 domain-containing protein n=1 Tax=Panicum miliaceum TaxID=4540 RepID=A0A3L6Q305_PANMI|nr:uncharacterized protein C2845_PM17G08960 [Panicum miliaceum]